MYPTELEHQLLTNLKKGDLESAITLYHKLIHTFQDFRFDSIKFSIKRLYLTTHLLCDKLTHSNASNLNRVGYIEQTLNSLTSFKEMDELFYKLFSEITTYVNSQKHSASIQLTLQIKDIVDKNFCDSCISLQTIADSLSMSPVYIGRVFKSVEGTSVSEYINNCRISKTQELLLSTTLTVKEISQFVGFISDTYLYTLFKNHTGHTPNEFRRINSITPSKNQ